MIDEMLAADPEESPENTPETNSDTTITIAAKTTKNPTARPLPSLVTDGRFRSPSRREERGPPTVLFTDRFLDLLMTVPRSLTYADTES
ncbi:hypothetical protein CSQ87_02245 [Bifidobacterium simiarum]|uniref:Uncharacterized protein n=1 Tax=Bifidobacterium simiarum TaxID=2045441 RepID=A0A2M9HG27_9BIFI|nr:hypothetical protein CSQ87_02245 [Bifidobacterium simiarum]